MVLSRPFPMRCHLLVLIFSVCPAAPVFAADRCEGVSSMKGGGGPRSGERLEYELTLGGAYMGRLELSVGAPRKVEGRLRLPLLGRLRTNALMSAIKEVEGRYMALVDPDSLSPLGVKMEAKVGSDRRWEEVRFYKEGKEAETQFLFREKERKLRYGTSHELLEGLSLLHLARTVTLKPGLTGCQEIVSARRLWRVDATVMAKESVQTPIGPKTAFRVQTKFTRQGTSKRKPKPVLIDILLGDLPGQPPLAFEMRQQSFVGRARLIRWKPGRKTS